MPQTTLERDRIERRKNGVFVVSTLGGLLALFAGFSFAMAACAHSLNTAFSGVIDLGTNHGELQLEPDVQPIPVPQSACPSLRVVSAAAKDAARPWADAFNPSVDPAQFSKMLAQPLASLDAALGAAVDHVPGPVASDFRIVREKVEIGRLNLPVQGSVQDYSNRFDVAGGYSTLHHASRLVGDACGFEVAPLVPFQR